MKDELLKEFLDELVNCPADEQARILFTASKFAADTINGRINVMKSELDRYLAEFDELQTEANMIANSISKMLEVKKQQSVKGY